MEDVHGLQVEGVTNLSSGHFNILNILRGHGCRFASMQMLAITLKTHCSKHSAPLGTIGRSTECYSRSTNKGDVLSHDVPHIFNKGQVWRLG